LMNQTFAEIVSWKLKSQYAYPSAMVTSLTMDMLGFVQRINSPTQNSDPKEPWRRIFRLWVCDESLPSIEERTGYPLEYLDLLLLRLKKLKAFLRGNRASLLECLENPDLKEFGLEQLGFLYQFLNSSTSEPLFKERMVLEQVILELGLPLQVSDLVTLLEIVHAHEGRIDERALASTMNFNQLNLFPFMIEGLIFIHFLQRNKAGNLTLTEKSADAIAAFLAPKLLEQLRTAVAINDAFRAKQILLEMNPKVLIKVIDDVVRSFSPDQAYALLKGIFKEVNRRVDLHLLSILGQYEAAFQLLLACLGDHDSLIRAKACEALGHLGNKDATFRLIQLLLDPVPGVKEMAAQALGDLGAVSAVRALLRVSEDYGESLAVRAKAREALRKIEAGQPMKLKADGCDEG
ncbi:MAG: HEAT repeat domain-containing protein, partial [Desulfitobacterium hafniense]|nr:HEAT repeat domain-containing protein [Desulfitobacterium hafniense]